MPGGQRLPGWEPKVLGQPLVDLGLEAAGDGVAQVDQLPDSGGYPGTDLFAAGPGLAAGLLIVRVFQDLGDLVVAEAPAVDFCPVIVIDFLDICFQPGEGFVFLGRALVVAEVTMEDLYLTAEERVKGIARRIEFLNLGPVIGVFIEPVLLQA